MIALPEWATVVDGLDPAGAWCAIVCTDRGHHDPEVLGVVFEHVDGRGRHWIGPHIHLTKQTDHDGNLIPGRATLPGSLRRQTATRRSSVLFTCPRCTRKPRRPREWWARLTEAMPLTREFDSSQLD
ncbi:hypothetical protein [Nocardioides immobilis]|uniref:hypothetical protein n=1 Tax=Nocardioides immobilis TaxID=2049295 RepID=UPI0011C49CF8|nr:hypothetical protein [Nocardioides immobilis]